MFNGFHIYEKLCIHNYTDNLRRICDTNVFMHLLENYNVHLLMIMNINHDSSNYNNFKGPKYNPDVFYREYQVQIANSLGSKPTYKIL